MHTRWLLLLSLLGDFATTVPLQAHCEIPCGIYGDPLRFSMIDEDLQLGFSGLCLIQDYQIRQCILIRTEENGLSLGGTLFRKQFSSSIAKTLAGRIIRNMGLGGPTPIKKYNYKQ